MRSTMDLIEATDRLARQLSQIAGAARQMGVDDRAVALEAMAGLLATLNHTPLAAPRSRPAATTSAPPLH